MPIYPQSAVEPHGCAILCVGIKWISLWISGGHLLGNHNAGVDHPVLAVPTPRASVPSAVVVVIPTDRLQVFPDLIHASAETTDRILGEVRHWRPLWISGNQYLVDAPDIAALLPSRVRLGWFPPSHLSVLSTAAHQSIQLFNISVWIFAFVQILQ